MRANLSPNLRRDVQEHSTHKEQASRKAPREATAPAGAAKRRASARPRGVDARAHRALDGPPRDRRREGRARVAAMFRPRPPRVAGRRRRGRGLAPRGETAAERRSHQRRRRRRAAEAASARLARVWGGALELREDGHGFFLPPCAPDRRGLSAAAAAGLWAAPRTPTHRGALRGREQFHRSRPRHARPHAEASLIGRLAEDTVHRLAARYHPLSTWSICPELLLRTLRALTLVARRAAAARTLRAALSARSGDRRVVARLGAAAAPSSA